jgi:hypothetical protein
VLLKRKARESIRSLVFLSFLFLVFRSLLI